MKYLLCFLCLCLSFRTQEAMPFSGKTTIKITSISFIEAYCKVRELEGNYVNDPLDLGKETYAGITTRYNPDWYGWRYIKNKKLKRCQYVPEAELWVLDYYLDIWVKEGFYKLRNQEVANYLFDTRIHLSQKRTIQLINDTYNLKIDNNAEWITYKLNRIDLSKLREARINYYYKRFKKNPTQLKFKRNWLRRAKL